MSREVSGVPAGPKKALKITKKKRPRGVAAPAAKFAVVAPLQTLYTRGRGPRGSIISPYSMNLPSAAAERSSYGFSGHLALGAHLHFGQETASASWLANESIPLGVLDADWSVLGHALGEWRSIQ